MKRFLKLTATVLLLLDGSAAIYGGLNMITEPDGTNMQLSTELLRYSIFDDFLIPGVMLLILIGVSSIYTMVAVITSFKKYWLLVILQGVILACWLIIQIAMIHFISIMHLVLLIVAFLLILTGYDLAPPDNNRSNDGTTEALGRR